MRIKSLLLSLFLCLPVIAGDPWSKSEIAMETTFQVLLFVDWKQTSNFHNINNTDQNGITYTIQEHNMFLGTNPKQSTINLYCITSALGHLVVSNMMEHKDRQVWQGLTIAVELWAVNGNYRIGAKIRW